MVKKKCVIKTKYSSHLAVNRWPDVECASSADFYNLNEAIGKVPESSANTQKLVVVPAPQVVVADEPVQQVIVQEVVRDVQQQYEPAQQILIEVTAPEAPVDVLNQEQVLILEPVSLPAVVIPEPVAAEEPQAPIVVTLANEPVVAQQVSAF